MGVPGWRYLFSRDARKPYRLVLANLVSSDPAKKGLPSTVAPQFFYRLGSGVADGGGEGQLPLQNSEGVPWNSIKAEVLGKTVRFAYFGGRFPKLRQRRLRCIRSSEFGKFFL